MKLARLSLLLICSGAIWQSVPAQSQVANGAEASKPGESSSANKPTARDDLDKKTPTQLFEEADSYARKKFEAFEKLKMPYDDLLKQRIEREQRELAAKYSDALAARKLSGSDIYYQGL